MEKIRAGLPRFSELSRRERVLLAVCAVLVAALIASVCISVNMRVNMQREYAAVRQELGKLLYSDLYMLIQTFNMTTVPNADVRNVIIPEMRRYFVASDALNEAITNAFGQRYRLLTDADVSAINAAFNAYESAFRSESPTDLAQADMLACMNRVRELLASRYSGDVLRAAR